MISELRNNVINQLVKTNRHYKAMVILSSQHCSDLMPAARKQIDNWLLFGQLAKPVLEMIFRDADFPCDYEDFIEMYKVATRNQYGFLYASTLGDLRINFDKKIIPPQ